MGGGGGLEYQSGYNPAMFTAPFSDYVSNRAEAAMRGDASARTAAAFRDANQAFGVRAQQLGDYGGGVEAGALADIEMERAAQDAASQRAVTEWAATQNQENKRAFAPFRTQLQLANAEAYARDVAAQNAFAQQQQARGDSIAARRASLAAAGRD